MPIKEAEELWPTGPEVLLTLEEAVQMAEEMSAPFALRINAILSIVCLVLVGLLAPALRRPIVTG